MSRERVGMEIAKGGGWEMKHLTQNKGDRDEIGILVAINDHLFENPFLIFF